MLFREEHWNSYCLVVVKWARSHAKSIYVNHRVDFVSTSRHEVQITKLRPVDKRIRRSDDETSSLKKLLTQRRLSQETFTRLASCNELDKLDRREEEEEEEMELEEPTFGCMCM